MQIERGGFTKEGSTLSAKESLSLSFSRRPLSLLALAFWLLANGECEILKRTKYLSAPKKRFPFRRRFFSAEKSTRSYAAALSAGCVFELLEMIDAD
jgi:hypothetical protein